MAERTIFLNILKDAAIDCTLLDKEYVFFCVNSKGYRTRADVCDHVSKIKNVVSVKNAGSGSELHIMAKKIEGIERNIKDSIHNSKYGLDCTLRQQQSSSMLKRDLMQLMLNSLHRSHSYDAVSSASGRFFRICETKKYEESNELREIITMEFLFEETDAIQKFQNELCLSTKIITFTNIREKDYMRFRKNRPFETFPQYVFNHNSIKRNNDEKDIPLYIIRKATKRKNKINFLDFSDENKLENSKSGIIQKTVKLFNIQFEGITSIDFDSARIDNFSRPIGSKDFEYYQERANKIVTSKPIFIVNNEGAEGETACRDLIVELEKRCLRPMVVKDTKLDCFRINIVHEKDYFKYDSEADTYEANEKGTNQHVAIESFKGKKRGNIAEVILEELSIKSDVVHKQMTLYDWGSKGYIGDYTFALPLHADDGESFGEYATLTVSSTGKLSFSFHEFEDDSMPFAISDAATTSGVDAVIMNPSKNVVAIRNSGIITMPYVQRIKSLLNANEKHELGTKGLRNEEGRIEYLAECIDINTLHISKEKWLYYVGVIGKGMKSTLETAANVREIISWENSEIFFDEIIELMAVPFVRHDQTTVLPFPFKYLREWIKMNGPALQ